MHGPQSHAPNAAFFWRFFIPLAAFVIIGIALPMILIIPGQRAFLYERARAETLSTAELAARVLGRTLDSNQIADVKDEMAALRRSYDMFEWMSITSPTGKVLAHTERGHEGKLSVDLVPPPVSPIVKTLPGSDGQSLIVTVPLRSGVDVRGTLRAQMRIHVPVPAWTGIGHLAALTGCLLGFACLVTLQLARWQKKPQVIVRERIVAERVEDKAPVAAPAPQPHNELLAAIVDATPAGLFVIDEVTRKIHHANGAFCRLWDLETLQDEMRAGSADYEAVATRCNGQCDQLVLPALGASDLDPLRLVDEELRTRDGRLIRCFSFPLALGGRHVRLYVHTDITGERGREHDLSHAVASARATLQEKAAFHAQVARTLRAPLNGLLGTIAILQDTSLSAQQSTYLDTVRGSAEDVLGMINNLLDLAALDAGELHLASSPFTLRRIVHEALEPFALLADRKNIDLAGAIADGIPNGYAGDADRLRQVLTNLVCSAVHATDHGDVIVQVSAAPEESTTANAGLRIATDGSRSRAPAARQAPAHTTLRFEVKDSGHGITPDEQSSLFQIMGAQSADAQYRTHLPLLLAKRLVELMGGHVGVASDPGRGTTLWFTVPLQVEAQAKDEIDPAVDTFGATRVLVVDDNATVRALLEQQLCAWHIAGEGTASGAEALRLIRSASDYGTPYNLVIVDLQMPEMDGLTLAELIHKEPRMGDLPVILLTPTPAVSGDTYPGIAATLSKPVHPSALYNALVTHLGVKAGGRRTVPSRTSANRRSGPRGRLLLAEDNLVNQKIALRMLDKLGYQTDVVANGSEAVEAAGRTQYDAILMDCQMPEMDGVTATTIIRQHESADHHVPIIAVTANNMESDRERCLAAGMNDFLAKPVRSADIEAVLERWALAKSDQDAAHVNEMRLVSEAAHSA